MRTRLPALALMTWFAGCITSVAPPDGSAAADMAALDDSGSAASCNDNIRNGAETDIDCGGPICPACGDGKRCLLAGDCQSGHCLDNVCIGLGGEMGPIADLAMSPGVDLATLPTIDLSQLPMDLSVPPDMSMPDIAMPITCTFDDPNSLFDDCLVGP